MPLRTATRSTPYIIGSSVSPETLTADFSDNAVSFPTEMYDGMKVYISYIPAENARNCSIQVEFGPESSDFYVDSTEKATSTGETDLLQWIGTVEGTTLGTEYKRAYRVPVDSSYVRISVREDGVANFGTVEVKGEFKISRI